jgi:hypothetical protein
MDIRMLWRRLEMAVMQRVGYTQRALHWIWEGEEFSKHWQERVREHKWIFVLGCNNSGTTLTSNVLGLHPAISTLPREGQKMTKVMPQPKELGCPRLWTERLDAFRLTESDNGYNKARLVYDWINYKKSDSTEFILEKSPPDTLRSRWLQGVFDHCYFIGLVRNGYAVCEGMRRRNGHSLERCARHWNLVNKIMIEDSRFLNRFKLLRYEELTRDPAAAFDSLSDFLGIDKTPFRSIAEKKFVVHNIDGRQSQIRDFNASSLSRLSPEDREVITLHAREMLDYFGYLTA